MTIVEFQMKGGGTLYARADAVHAWTLSIEDKDKDWCRVWIGGRQYESVETVAEVTAKMRACLS